MPWIGSVAPYDTIQSLWGNTIRDHVVHVFATRAERNAQAVPTEGMCCYCTDVATLYVWHSSAWNVLAMPWRSFAPKAWAVDTANTASRTPLSTTSGIGYWRQSLGVVQSVAEYQSALQPSTGVISYYLALYGGPPTANFPATAGATRVGVSSTNLAHGGGSVYLFNDTPSGSGWLMANVGAGVAPYSTVQTTTGPTPVTLYFSFAFTFGCDPSFDP